LAGGLRDLPLAPPPVSQSVDASMTRDTKQVRHQARTPSGIRRDVLPEYLKGVEHDFLCLIPIMEHALCNAEEPWAGQLNQLDQRLFIPRDETLPKRQLPLRCPPLVQLERLPRPPTRISRYDLPT
jgi:hypothetical protein